MLVANCLTAAAFLVYCSPMNADTRRRTGAFFMSVCEHHGLPIPTKQLFKNTELVNYLYAPVSTGRLK